MFWYYLEEIRQAPKIKPDVGYPLAHMPFDDIRQCAFRVLYYDTRIAVEFFHATTDGNGGLVFLKTLTAEYLVQKYGAAIPCTNGVLDRGGQPAEEELEDSFLKYQGDVVASRRTPTAYRLTGTPESDRFLHLTTGVLDVNEALQIARAYHVSLTEFLAAVMIASIVEIQNETMPNRKRQRPVKVLIPVNLRKMFDSTSLRNFVLYITPGINPRMGEYTFEEILKTVHHQMGMELNDKQMASLITANVKAEKAWAIKIMPLFVKNMALKVAYNMVGEKKSCLSISNLGAVTLPQEMTEYVERFDFILGIQATSPNNCGVLSYGDKLYISFIRNIKEPTLEEQFFTTMIRLGLHVKIESNQR